MKNLVAIFIIIIFNQPAAGQNKPSFYEDFPYFIIDTTLAPSTGEFYVVDITGGTPNHDVIVRDLNEKYAIVRSGKALTNQQKKYYKLDNSWKLSTRIVNAKAALHAQQLFSVKYAAFTDPDFLSSGDEIELIRSIENAQIALIKTTLDVVINQLIHNPNIEYVDRTNHEARGESPIRQYNINLNKINYARHHYPNLMGSGTNISLKEHSIFEGDIDLIGRVVLDENSSAQFTQHAREMGTLIAGKGNSFKTGTGVVSEANLVCTNFNLLFAEPASYYNSYNINLQNHSYGTGIENYYGNEAISFDQIATERPELVHVFSAGNMGDQAPEQGTYEGIEGYANLTGTFKQAKNVLVIGALESTGNYVDRSSSGPAYDGRIKPELCAFGGEGSSESAALVSGSAAMLQEHYRNLYDSQPRSSLIKSLLIAGANDVHTPGIDYKTGYGSLDLKSALQLLDSGWFMEGAIGSNSVNSFEIAVANNIAEMKVALAWTDPPANPEDVTALVNDLDMSITTPSNAVLLPWVLNATPDVNALAELPIRGEDHLNNVELITLEDPAPGVYTVHIASGQLLGDDQSLSVAYYMKYRDQFAWTFPTSSDHLEAGTHHYFQWDTSYPVQEANLYIRYGQESWESLGGVDIEAQLFNYLLKDTSASVQLKMEVSGREFPSDIFTVSRLARVRVENDCEDEFILSWSSNENAQSYSLTELQGDELVEILSTIDTVVSVAKDNYAASYYAVQPVLPEERKALRSYAINYEDNNKGCYLNNFLAFLSLDDLVNLQLSVNLPQEIQEITIQKEQYGGQQLFAQFQPGTASYFEFDDEDLSPGRITYSAQLLLSRGATISSDTLAIYYTDDKTVIVFPNPTYGDFASVLNDYPGGSLQLLDDKGTFVRTYELVSLVDPLDLTGLRSGTYMFRIFYQGALVHTGKIVRMR